MNVQSHDAIELSNAAARLLSANGSGHPGADRLASELMSKAQKLLAGDVVAERNMEFQVLCAVLRELGLNIPEFDDLKALTITVNPLRGFDCNVEVLAHR